MRNLKTYLQNKTHIETVYFNENGEWSFVKHPNFPKEVSRKEVMKMKDEEPNETETTDLKASIATKDAEIAELKAQIEDHGANDSKAQEEINSRDKEIVELGDKVAMMDAELNKKQEVIDGKDKEIADLKEKIASLNAAIKDLKKKEK